MSATTPWTYDVMKQKALAVTAFFETSTSFPACYGVVSGNFDGAGMSFGTLQFNLGTGNLQPIFTYMIDNYPTVTKNAFQYSTNPTYYNTFVDIMKNKTKTEQIAWADSISVASNKHLIIEPWKTYINALGVTQECMNKQVALAESYWTQAYNMFQEVKAYTPLPNMYSRRLYALLFDIAVQNWDLDRYKTINGVSTKVVDTRQMIKDAFAQMITSGKTSDQIELEKMQIIANKVADSVTQSGSVWGEAVRTRKLICANGTGSYYGTPIDLATYEMTMEEAFPVALSQQSAGYLQYITATGRTQNADGAVGVTITSGNYPVNFTTMKTGGAKFVYMRASTGMSGTDTQFTSANIASARSAGLKVGFYHSAVPSNSAHNGTGKTTDGATREANWFCDRIVAVMGSDFGDVLPAISWADSNTTWASDDEAYNWLDTFNNIVKQRLGRTVILATGYYYVDENITGVSVLKHSANGGIGKKMPLWLLATDTGTYPSYGFTAFGDFKVNKWTIWQYSTTGTGATYGVATASAILNYMDNLSVNANPVAPTGLIATAGDAKVTLAWDKPTAVNVTGFKVYRNGTLIATTTDINTATYEDTGLINGTEYSYAVSAVTDWQDSPQTSTVLATPVQPFVSLFPYYPEYSRDEEITGNWTFDNPIKQGTNTVLTTANVGSDTPDKLVTRAYLDGTGNVIQGNLNTHKADTNNPHAVTKAQIGLGNVDNTSDLNKPISNATQTALNGKAEKTANETITGFYSFKNGVALYGTKINATKGNGGAGVNQYVHLARVYLGVGATWRKNFFNMSIFIGGDTLLVGEFEGFVYSQGTNSTYAGNMCQTYSKDRYTWSSSSQSVTAVKSTGADGSAIVDFYITLPNNGDAYVVAQMAFADTSCSIEVNPSKTVLVSVPAVASTFSYNSVTYTVQTNNTAPTNKTFTTT